MTAHYSIDDSTQNATVYDDTDKAIGTLQRKRVIERSLYAWKLYDLNGVCVDKFTVTPLSDSFRARIYRKLSK